MIPQSYSPIHLPLHRPCLLPLPPHRHHLDHPSHIAISAPIATSNPPASHAHTKAQSLMERVSVALIVEVKSLHIFCFCNVILMYRVIDVSLLCKEVVLW